MLLALAGVVLGWRVLSLETPSVPDVRARGGNGRWPQFVVLLLAMSFIGMVYRGMTTFLPKLFALSYASEGAAGTAVGGLLTTLALLVGLVGMYVAGRAIDRGLSPARAFLIGALVQAPFLVLVSIVGPSWLLPVMMSVAFFHFFTQPPGNMMVADFIPPRIRGLGYGIYFFVSFGAGSLGAAYGGWVSERHGLTSAFSALAWFLIPAVAAALLLVTMRTERSPEGADPS
jgi:MFS family permease